MDYLKQKMRLSFVEGFTLSVFFIFNGTFSSASAENISSIAKQTKVVESVFVGKFVKKGSRAGSDGFENSYLLFMPVRILKGPPCGSGEIRVSASSSDNRSFQETPKLGSLWIVCVTFTEEGLWKPEKYSVGRIEYNKHNLDLVLKALLCKSKDRAYNNAFKSKIYNDIDSFVSKFP